MTIYKYEILINRITKTGTIEADSFQDAMESVKALYPESTYISIGLTRFYTGEIDRITGNTQKDLVSWFDTYTGGVTEVQPTLKTIGMFATLRPENLNDKIPFLFVEDTEENILEYYAYKMDGTLLHETY